jgi:hypothetical protein
MESVTYTHYNFLPNLVRYNYSALKSIKIVTTCKFEITFSEARSGLA